ncbi:MAG: TetR/AcrR family transcriptional regulator [Actinomycetota bacterium]
MSESTAEPTRTRGHKKKARTRRKLLSAAVDVIAARGESFTVSDVVAHAGVSHGTFYNYFDDREQLIEAVVPEVLRAFAAEGAANVVDADPATRFATITAMAFVRAGVTPDAVRVVLRLETVQQAIRSGAVVAHLRSDLAEGAASGRFDVVDPDATLDVVLGTMLLACRRIIDDPVADEYPSQVIDVLLRSLGLDRVEASTIAEASVARAVQLQLDAVDGPTTTPS